ncbi:cytochrome P450 [Actinomadura namibiensis]|uniref:cytochrome P450 n=1 Tax=Actinomadura kijaniata TaxID=46161 RepID=UPI00361C33B2
MTRNPPESTAAARPVRDYVTGRAGALAMTGFREMDEHRAAAGAFMWTEDAGGHWVFTSHDSVMDALLDDDLWSNAVDFTFNPDAPKLPPLMLDGEEHLKWRRLLAAWFTPRRIRSMRDRQRAMAAEVIDGVAARGECDYLADVARVFPTMVVLQLMGLPMEDTPMFLDIVERAVGRSPEGPAGCEPAERELMAYLADLLAQRRAHPDPEARDVVSAAVGWKLDDAPVDDEELLKCLTLLTVAGLDTTASQVSWTMLHLATHPEHRRRLVAEPELADQVVEESLRVFPIAQQPRKATRDAVFHGCPVRKGDNALVAMAAAGRDSSAYPRATEFDLDRGDVSHASLGAGRHLCLGAHLARQEMVLLLQEWHRRIPEYRLVEWPTETCGVVWSVDELRLAW